MPGLYSTNRLVLNAEGPATCVDCTFELAESLKFVRQKCAFCGGDRFFRESPFGLAFLGRYLVCYVCDAEYDQKANFVAAKKFEQLVADEMQKTTLAEAWKARAAKWH